MMAVERAANLCIEFCSLIEKPDKKNKERIKEFLKFIDETVDHSYSGSLDNVADSIEHKVQEIFEHLPDLEIQNIELGDLYLEIHQTLCNHYQESNSSTFSDYYCESIAFEREEEEENEGNHENDEEE